MRVIDISVPIHAGMPTYPGDPAVGIERVSAIERGDGSNLSMLAMSTHAGTHVDPPLHFVEGGAGVDQLPFEALIGDVHVLDLRGTTAIGAGELEGADLPDSPERLLFRTDGTASLTSEGARWTVGHGVRLVGIDALSIEDLDAGGGTFPVHRTLLEAGVVILEGLDLREAPTGPATLWCLPLNIRDGDGAPARAVLVVD